MSRRLLRTALAAAALCLGAAASAQVAYTVATGEERGTYQAIGRDLAKLVAPEAGIELEVRATPGSAANVRLLRHEAGVKLALIQADVFQAFLDRASTDREAASLIRPLRIITPLFDTELHFFVRADSPMGALHDIRAARINGGPLGSGAALTTHAVYRRMFGAAIPEGSATYHTNEEALVRLVTDRSVDVVVVAAGQPAQLVANMKPEAQKLVKLLRLDPQHPASREVLEAYPAATVRASSYPNLLREDVPTIAVTAHLVTFDHPRGETANTVARFARELCRNLPALREQGHPKWREVELTLPILPPGWTYYPPTTREINTCMNAAQSRPRARPPAQACTAEARVLGLCR